MLDMLKFWKPATRKDAVVIRPVEAAPPRQITALDPNERQLEREQQLKAGAEIIRRNYDMLKELASK